MIGEENEKGEPFGEEQMEKVYEFLKEAGTYFLATAEGDQPRVRPFGTIHCYEGKLYLQTGKGKKVSKQLSQNPKVELCAMKDGEWLRVSGVLERDDRTEAQESLLSAYPELRARYTTGPEGNTEVWYFKEGTAVFSSFTKPDQTLRF